MKFGITVNFQHSFFSSGSPQTVLSVSEIYRLLGHHITLIDVSNKESLWWDDIQGMKSSWNCVKGADISGCQYDCVIEVGSSLLPRERRDKFKKSIWLHRKSAIFHDIEASLFPFEKPERCLEGVHEIWMYDEMTSSDDVQYMELLTRKPVRLVPYSWTPSAVELHRQEMKAPVWQQIANVESLKNSKWSIHICETNMSSSSSSTIPLLIMREVRKSNLSDINTIVKIHNADNIRQTKFFQQNVLDHVFSDIQDMSGQFIGRQRIIDWVYDPKSIVIAHSRFYDIRSYLIDCLWVGIPLVHNSKFLCKFGESVSKGYYADNEISQGADAFGRMTAGPLTIEELLELRKKILDEVSPFSQKIQGRWNDVLVKVDVEVEVESKSKPSVGIVESIGRPQLRVGFTCMWDAFNPEYNMFTLLLEAAGCGDVVGMSIDDMKEGEEDIDVLIFGPFGSGLGGSTCVVGGSVGGVGGVGGSSRGSKKRWETVKRSVPKIHFTGENTPAIQREDVLLNLGFQHTDMNDGKYLRLPLWMLEINWFNADAERIQNPKPIPIDRCCKVYPEEIARKTKFCAFVVTNPCQTARNNAFQWLSKYKHIDSAGRLFNNMGDGIFAGFGGGGGELKKHEFLKDYKFCLAYENAESPGYTTEKFLHAKAAGCIPIYWGDPKVERDFDMNGCIDARHVKTSEELIELVKNIDTNSEEYLKRLSRPALDDVRRDLVRRTLSECAKRIWSLSGKVTTEGLEKIPKFLGDTQTSLSTINTNVSLDLTTFITGANQRFLSSLHAWLTALAPQKKEVTEMRVIVYLFPDVSEEVEKNYKDIFPFLEVRRFPSDIPGTFTDFWDPQHFAWKLWILDECMKDSTLTGKPLLYLDSGAMMCRWPREWMSVARQKGICFLEDPRHTNKYWCHDEFNKRLQVTEGELTGNQLWAGAICCIAGHPLATRVFSEAYSLACVKEVIVGEKWSGMKDGRPFGHRHDQSILSILSLRMKLPRYNLDKVYCDVSLRQTFLTKKALYIHRGLFQIHHPLASGIDDAWVINLDRRKDRMDSFLKANGDIAERVHRVSAVEGSKLHLTPNIARLFAPHDFNWKKPVMGCALSHLSLWMQLANEKEEVNSYLILEDDARLNREWKDRWEKIYKHECMPGDWDVVYLGGILPPNKRGFEELIEPVNKYMARIKKNTSFGQKEPDRYMHFCAYAYVLSRRGAIKILDYLKSRGGYWTSADHMICNIHHILNIYFPNPLLAGCFQDDDPIYCNSQFNDFSRIDTFDSDLWTNTERFSEEEVKAVLDTSLPLNITAALEDARNVIPVKKGPRFVSVAGPTMDMSKWYEYSWIKDIFSFMNSFEIEDLDEMPRDCPIVVVQRPYVDECASVLKGWSDAGLKFFVLHMSDEFRTDRIDFYDLPGCRGVVRNYMRDGLGEKVHVIPLGYHWAIPNGEPLLHTPRPPFRELVWSFVGTNWLNRKEKLQILNEIPGEKKIVFMDDWNSPNMIGKDECLSILLNSWCVPCPSGHNHETYRFYEALEAGAIPVLVKEDNSTFLKYICTKLHFMVAESWQHAAQLIFTLKSQPEIYEKYRTGLLMEWEELKKKTRNCVKELLTTP